MIFAILGYGFMGGVHLAAMQKIAVVTVKTVATRTKPSTDAPTRGNLNLESGPIPESVHWTPDWRTAIEDPKIDAVDVCLPTDMHREVVTAALAEGKHVLSEKPLALTLSDCAAITEVAQKSGRIFMVGQVLRFMYPYQYAAKFIDGIGRNKITQSIFRRSTGYPHWGGWLAQEQRSGGATVDLMSHDLDQALSLFGAPRSVSAVSLGEVDTVRATLHYNSGLDVIVEGGWLASDVPFSASFEISAEEKQLMFRDDRLFEINRNVRSPVAIPAHDPYFDEIAYFVACCQNNTRPALCLTAESALAVQLALQLKASREAGGLELAWQD